MQRGGLLQSSQPLAEDFEREHVRFGAPVPVQRNQLGHVPPRQPNAIADEINHWPRQKTPVR